MTAEVESALADWCSVGDFPAGTLIRPSRSVEDLPPTEPRIILMITEAVNDVGGLWTIRATLTVHTPLSAEMATPGRHADLTRRGNAHVRNVATFPQLRTALAGEGITLGGLVAVGESDASSEDALETRVEFVLGLSLT